MSFVGLHIHSDYSLLDGASQIPQLIDRALELKMPAIAIDYNIFHRRVYQDIDRAESTKPTDLFTE